MITNESVPPEPDMQFDDLEQQHHASLLGMWTFLATELLLFGALFGGFVVLRVVHAPAFFEAAHHLDLVLATINTAVLLTSGLTMALADRMAWVPDRRAALAFLGATIVLGLIFLGIKAYEWYHEYTLALMPILGLPFDWPGADPGGAELFFNFYYAMTGLHAMHMVIGVGVLAVMAVPILRMRDPLRMARQVQGAALYWAFIDIIWIFIFLLLYLLR